MDRGIGFHVLPATNISPLPTSLTPSWKVCSSRLRPPAKKHAPRQSSKLARMDPKIAALIIGIEFSPSLVMNTMKRMISTTDPNVTSSKTPNTTGSLRASSWPQKPIRLAAGIMAIKLRTKIHRCRSGRAKCWKHSQLLSYVGLGRAHTMAMAAGTNGHRIFTAAEMRLELWRRHIRRKCSG